MAHRTNMPDLPALAAAARTQGQGDPFATPVLAMALALSRRLDDGDLTLDTLRAALRQLGDLAFADRATALARKLGGTDAHAATDESITTAPLPRARMPGSTSRVRSVTATTLVAYTRSTSSTPSSSR